MGEFEVPTSMADLHELHLVSGLFLGGLVDLVFFVHHSKLQQVLNDKFVVRTRQAGDSLARKITLSLFSVLNVLSSTNICPQFL